jgi:hypothetical protein
LHHMRPDLFTGDARHWRWAPLAMQHATSLFVHGDS